MKAEQISCTALDFLKSHKNSTVYYRSCCGESKTVRWNEKTELPFDPAKANGIELIDLDLFHWEQQDDLLDENGNNLIWLTIDTE